MKYSNHFMSLVAVLLTLSLSLGPAATRGRADTGRPTYLGFAPAYPTGLLITKPQSDLLRNRVDSLVWLTLEISPTGTLEQIVGDSAVDSTVAKHLAQFMAALEFVPASRNGRNESSRLPIAARIRPGGVMPLVDWPIDTLGRVRDHHLYAKALTLNGIQPPQLKRFPGYHAVVPRRDSVSVYPFVLARVDLDSMGVPTAIEAVRSTAPGFTDQILTACNWTTYEPARVGETAQPATVHVLVSLFPELHYPVGAIDFAELDSLSRFDQQRVRVLLDTTGPLSKPLPRALGEDSLMITGGARIPPATGTALCLIDTAGRARAGRVSTTSHYHPRVQKTVAALPFYPALDWDGSPIRFAGPMSFNFPGSAYARIQLLWLPADNTWLRP